MCMDLADNPYLSRSSSEPVRGLYFYFTFVFANIIPLFFGSVGDRSPSCSTTFCITISAFISCLYSILLTYSSFFSAGINPRVNALAMHMSRDFQDYGENVDVRAHGTSRGEKHSQKKKRKNASRYLMIDCTLTFFLLPLSSCYFYYAHLMDIWARHRMGHTPCLV